MLKMILEKHYNRTIYYTCFACARTYREKSDADECEEWCAKRGYPKKKLGKHAVHIPRRKSRSERLAEEERGFI